jgi:hypothetical protein
VAYPIHGVTRKLGITALAGALVSWGLLFSAMLMGGLDPPQSLVPLLKIISGSSILIATGSLTAGVVAAIRGPQRILGGIGLIIAITFVLAFTGPFFAIFR